MPRDARAYLWDIEDAGNDILSFTQGKSFADYASSALLRAAVERKFEIVGEALVKLAHHFPGEATKIDNYRSFIGFRNVLIHQYEDLKHANIWNEVQTSLPILLAQVGALRQELDTQSPLP